MIWDFLIQLLAFYISIAYSLSTFYKFQIFEFCRYEIRRCSRIPLDNKNHIYYPDIYIPDQNRIIEVKSVWTYNLDINKILYKAREVSINHIFELWIYDSNKKLVSLTIMKNNEIILNTNNKFTLGILFENR
jgi:hypothetical protein